MLTRCLSILEFRPLRLYTDTQGCRLQIVTNITLHRIPDAWSPIMPSPLLSSPRMLVTGFVVTRPSPLCPVSTRLMESISSQLLSHHLNGQTIFHFIAHCADLVLPIYWIERRELLRLTQSSLESWCSSCWRRLSFAVMSLSCPGSGSSCKIV